MKSVASISRVFVSLSALAVFATAPGCSCDNRGHGGVGGGGSSGDGGGPPAIGSITIAPGDVTLDLVSGMAPPTASFVVTLHSSDGDHDVTNQSSFTLADPSLGVMNANVFTAGTAHGGTTTLVAGYDMQTAEATIHVKVHGSFTGPNCAGCTFPAPGAAACGGMDTQPTIVYPPDGVLLPPNMETISIQWLPGSGNTEFEIDLSNPASDVKVVTKCTPTVDTRGQMSGGCQLDLNGMLWDFVAASNKGGDPVNVTVRGTSNGTCASAGANSVAVSFAEQDVSGGIYYWKSTVSSAGTGGQIWRKSFGDATPEEQITGIGAIGGTCNGCHSLSRDGQRMTINSDDNDSDDEYSDISSGLIDVAAKMFIGGTAPACQPGFQTFSPDHGLYLDTDGTGNGKSAGGGRGLGTGGFGNVTIAANQMFLFDGNSGALSTPNSVNGSASATQRVTQPDWSADGKNVVFVAPLSIASWQGSHGGTLNDDDHELGGSLWTMPYNGSGMFGAPVEILHSPDDLHNNYYPSFSPDGSFVVFDRVDLTPGEFTGTPTLPDKDSFSNPHARVFVMSPAPGSMPIECMKLNGQSDSSNSWPRWSPFIQTYKGSKLLWVTFSSTRDYGLLVRNNASGNVQCYPPDSAEDPGGQHGTPFPANCKQPQIWMAAINLSSAEVMNPGDPSLPAFWLPFQDITTHNHTAQWTSTVVNTPPPDGGACIDGGQDCTKAPNNCCGALVCTANGTCGLL
jgi:hypothetical protein